MYGGTKKGEYCRSIDLFERIFNEQGTYYALAFLYDSQYEREDLGEMMLIMKKEGLRKKHYLTVDQITGHVREWNECRIGARSIFSSDEPTSVPMTQNEFWIFEELKKQERTTDIGIRYTYHIKEVIKWKDTKI